MIHKIKNRIKKAFTYKQFSFNNDQNNLAGEVEKRKPLEKIAYGSGLSNVFNGFNKTSDTVFILGSGESLSEITDLEWELIGKHDVFGVNMSLIHDFPVSYHFWEVVSTEQMNFLLEDVYLSKVYNGKDIRLVINNNHAIMNSYYESERFQVIKQNKYVSFIDCLNLKLQNPTPENLTALVEFLRRSGSQKPIHHCTHIGAVADFSYLMGYKNIVLIGCDLNGGKYFSEVESKSSFYRVNESYKEFNKFRTKHVEMEENNSGIQFGGIHATMNSTLLNSRGRITSKEYLEAMHGYYQNNGAELFVISRASTLFPKVPVYNLTN